MSEGNSEATTETTANAGDQQQTFEPITTQDALDKIVQTRLARERAKYEPLQTEVSDLKKQLEGASKIEADLTDARTRIGELESDLSKAQGETLRHVVASEKGVPVGLLSGTTRDELEASATAIQEYRDTAIPAGTYVPSEGRSDNQTPQDDARKLARSLFSKE